ncbi:MAG: hypothetical protein ACJ8AO_05575 [Gemmatimonadaceae bacterium]
MSASRNGRRPATGDRRLRLAAGALACALACALAAAPLRAQEITDLRVIKALDLEGQGKAREAAAMYRQLLGSSPNLSPVLLGLERAYVELGWADTLFVVVDSVIRVRARDPLPRTVQLRALRMAGRPNEARQAFERWTRDVPRDPTPYREYARAMLEEGRTALADSILRRAQDALGSGREVAGEVAQLRAAMGMWEPSAAAWREAVAKQAFLSQAAAFALQPAPATSRDAVRNVLRAAPVEPGARRVLAALELAWGRPGEAWAALRDLPRADATLEAWRDFAEQAELAEAWAPARDAFAALFAARPDADVAEHAARAALGAHDPATALAIADRAATLVEPARAASTLLPVAIRALGELGRVSEAEQRLQRAAPQLDAVQRAQLARQVAWGWVRAGDVARARQSLATAGPSADSNDVEDAEAAGLMALYEGDLATARARLRRSAETTPEHVLAMALLGRSRGDRSPAAGAAFLALARGDSAAAAARFIEAARELADAAPLLLATAARLGAGRSPADATALWRRVLAEHPGAPEAAEADLEIARALRARGRRRDGSEREHRREAGERGDAHRVV